LIKAGRGEGLCKGRKYQRRIILLISIYVETLGIIAGSVAVPKLLGFFGLASNF
jgi:hypothetical protein